MTAAEPRPVHIIWIATCRVYNSVVEIRRLLLGSPQATKTLQLINQSFIPSCETWAGAVVRFSRPRSTLSLIAYHTCAC